MVGPRHDRRSGAQRRSGTFRARSAVLLVIPFLLAAVLLISAERRWQSVAQQSLAKSCECKVGIWMRSAAAQPRKLSPGIAAALPPLPALPPVSLARVAGSAVAPCSLTAVHYNAAISRRAARQEKVRRPIEYVRHYAAMEGGEYPQECRSHYHGLPYFVATNTTWQTPVCEPQVRQCIYCL